MIVGTFFITRLLEFCLNNKQKFLLSKLINFEGTATKFASSIKELPKSTVWHNLRVLRKFGLVDFNGAVNLNPAVAQLVERPAVNRKVACASQACGTTKVRLIKPAGDN